MTQQEAQALYDELGTIASVATHLGWKSPQTAYVFLKKHGVKFRPRGGVYHRTHDQRMKHYAANRENKDPSLRARPVKRMLCVQGRSKDGYVLGCVFTDEINKYCPLCERGDVSVGSKFELGSSVRGVRA